MTPLTYEPMVGDPLDYACAEAIRLVQGQDRPVEFDFNGIVLTATTTSTVADLMADYDTRSAVKGLAWSQSPEGQNELMRRALEVQTQQARMDGAMVALTAAQDERAVMRALKTITDNADHIEVKLDEAVLLAELSKRGYKAGAETGLDKVAYLSRGVFARYIAGQVMDMAESGMPPHPGLVRFMDEWLDVHGHSPS